MTPVPESLRKRLPHDPPLTPAQRNETVMLNQGLLNSYVRRLYARNTTVARLGLEDALAAGQVGLLTAVDRWNGCRYSWPSYAKFWIRHEVQRWCQTSTAIKMPTRMIQGGAEFPFEVACHPFQDNGREERIPDPPSRGLDPCELVDLRDYLGGAMRWLRSRNPRDYLAVLWLAHGQRPCTIYRRLGVSRSRASQLVMRGLRRLRKYLEDQERRHGPVGRAAGAAGGVPPRPGTAG